MRTGASLATYGGAADSSGVFVTDVCGSFDGETGEGLEVVAGFTVVSLGGKVGVSFSDVCAGVFNENNWIKMETSALLR